MRILHFSDVHIVTSFSGVGLRQFANKRAVGWVNLQLRRRKYFEQADQKMAKLAEFARTQDVDWSVCTGDFTGLGTTPELRRARALIQPFTHVGRGLVTVPGNHDLYLHDSPARFDHYFGDLLGSDLPECSVDGVWPQVRLGKHVAIVAINSARPNPRVRVSSGAIPEAQLDALAQLLKHPRIRDRFVLLATHYAPRLADGTPDRPRHGLENAETLLKRCAGVRRGAIVFGHVHRRYVVRLPGFRLALCGAGSATQERHETAWLYRIEGQSAAAYPVDWNGHRYVAKPTPVAL